MTNLDHPWNIPPIDLELPENEVHVWRSALTLPAFIRQSLQRSLAPEESARAERFYFEKDRNHFIVARGLLRTLIGQYLKIEPDQVRFCYNSYGKPLLDPSLNQKQLSFNLSHSHDLVLYAFTYGREVGIDVEYMRPDVEYEQLAKYSFSPHENSMLQTLPASARQEAFFNCWSRKEAYIKARGMGLSLPLDSFDVSLRPDEPVALLHNRDDAQEAERWSFRELAAGHSYASALAVEGRDWHLNYWQWQA